MARRKLVWARMAPTTTSVTRIAGGVGQAVEIQDLLATFRSQAGLLKGPAGLTAVRLRMTIEWHADVAADMMSIRQNGFYYGVRVMDWNDVALQDITEVPDRGPQLDPHADWMTWGRIPVKYQDTTNVPTVQAGGWAEVDVRSMRKMEELGQTIALTLQTTLPTAGAAPVVVASHSILLALP